MARPKKNIIQLTYAEVKQLKCLLQKTNTCQTLVNRCRILLALDENHPPVYTYDQCMALFCVSRETIRRTLKKTGLDLTAVSTGVSQVRQMQNL